MCWARDWFRYRFWTFTLVVDLEKQKQKTPTALILRFTRFVSVILTSRFVSRSKWFDSDLLQFRHSGSIRISFVLKNSIAIVWWIWRRAIVVIIIIKGIKRWIQYLRLTKSWLRSKDKSMTFSVLCRKDKSLYLFLWSGFFCWVHNVVVSWSEMDSRSWRRSKMLIGRVGSLKNSLTKCVTVRGNNTFLMISSCWFWWVLMMMMMMMPSYWQSY